MSNFESRIHVTVTDFWLTVVTYGMASSPYNAVKTVNQCAIDNRCQYPEAADVVLSDFYVDDLFGRFAFRTGTDEAAIVVTAETWRFSTDEVVLQLPRHYG